MIKRGETPSDSIAEEIPEPLAEPISHSSAGRGVLTYLLLMAVQLFGSDFIVWKGLPAFRELVLAPGQQPANTPYDDNLTLAVLMLMQAAYWYRLLKVAIPFKGGRLSLSHLFLFLGRLNFIFGSAVFSIVLFRHLPELGPDTDVVLMARRGVLMVITLFALFCFTLELEVWGMHLARTNESSACGSTALSTEVCRRLSPLLPGRRDYCPISSCASEGPGIPSGATRSHRTLRSPPFKRALS
ncbi:hypothetical protein [Bradyrhizobium lupini]